MSIKANSILFTALPIDQKFSHTSDTTYYQNEMNAIYSMGMNIGEIQLIEVSVTSDLSYDIDYSESIQSGIGRKINTSRYDLYWDPLIVYDFKHPKISNLYPIYPISLISYKIHRSVIQPKYVYKIPRSIIDAIAISYSYNTKEEAIAGILTGIKNILYKYRVHVHTKYRFGIKPLSDTDIIFKK